MHSSNLSLALSLLIVLIGSIDARSECLVCDELIRIDRAQADCFLTQFEEIQAIIAFAPRGRASIDFDSCRDGATAGDRGGIIDLPDPDFDDPSDEEPITKSVFLLNADGAACLRDLIIAHDTGYATEFDLFEQCVYE